MNDPACNWATCKLTLKSVLAAMFSPGAGFVMMVDTMFSVDGMSPMTDGSQHIEHFAAPKVYHEPMPLHDPPFTCRPLVKVFFAQKLMKFAASLEVLSATYH